MEGRPAAGRVLHFGIREHGMGAIMNGIALHGGTRVFGGTFLTFSDYMRGSVRLAALMQVPVTYVWTHDSIGLGEDGPTHQPVEHLAALRAIPGLDVVRPADANETAAAWRTILEHTDRPGRPDPDPAERARRSRAARTGSPTTDDVGKGGYVLVDADGGQPDVILIGTGSEVQLAVEARDAARRPTASAPGWSRCRAASGSTRRTRPTATSVIPPIVKARVSVEAGVARAGGRWSATTAGCVSHRALRRLRRLRAHLQGVRHHRRGRRRAAEDSIAAADPSSDHHGSPTGNEGGTP